MLASHSINWPSTKGHLLIFKVYEKTAKAKFPSLMDDYKYCVLKIKYEYEVNGNLYKGSRIQFGKQEAYITPSELEASEFYSNLKQGKFTVYFFKSLPQISTLKTGLSNTKNHIFAIVFIISVGVLLYFMYVISSSLLHDAPK
jgi:hypothetical protein